MILLIRPDGFVREVIPAPGDTIKKVICRELGVEDFDEDVTACVPRYLTRAMEIPNVLMLVPRNQWMPENQQQNDIASILWAWNTKESNPFVSGNAVLVSAGPPNGIVELDPEQLDQCMTALTRLQIMNHVLPFT